MSLHWHSREDVIWHAGLLCWSALAQGLAVLPIQLLVKCMHWKAAKWPKKLGSRQLSLRRSRTFLVLAWPAQLLLAFVE